MPSATRCGALGAIVLLAGASGCGGDRFANDPPAPAEVTISAVVTVKRVSVSPSRTGAGIVELLASNQTPTSQRVRLRSVILARGAKPLAQSTGPINPGGTGSLKARLGEGTYVVSAGDSKFEPATLVVTRARGHRGLLQP